MQLLIHDLDRVTGGAALPQWLLGSANRVVIAGMPLAFATAWVTAGKVHDALNDHVNNMLHSVYRHGVADGRRTP